MTTSLKFREMYDYITVMPFAPVDEQSGARLIQWMIESPRITEAEAVHIYHKLFGANVGTSILPRIEDEWRRLKGIDP